MQILHTSVTASSVPSVAYSNMIIWSPVLTSRSSLTSCTPPEKSKILLVDANHRLVVLVFLTLAVTAAELGINRVETDVLDFAPLHSNSPGALSLLMGHAFLPAVWVCSSLRCQIFWLPILSSLFELSALGCRLPALRVGLLSCAEWTTLVVAANPVLLWQPSGLGCVTSPSLLWSPRVRASARLRSCIVGRVNP